MARKDESAICLLCGSTSETAPDAVIQGAEYAGGAANPEALARPTRARGGARGKGGTRAKGSTKPKSSAKAKSPAKATSRPRSRIVSSPGTLLVRETDEERYTRVIERTRPVEPAAEA